MTSDEPNIVELNHDNVHLLDAVAVEVFDHKIRKDSLIRFIDCPRHVMMLAVKDGKVVGMASAVEYFHPDKDPQLWINEVGVSPVHRNQGIGRSLIAQLLSWGEQRGCTFAWLGTEHDNVPAKKCYMGVPRKHKQDEFAYFEWKLEASNARLKK